MRNAAIFLYSSVKDAEARTKGGGSGFLVGVPSRANPAQAHLYAVSNEHVSTPCPVIRVIPQRGEVQIIDGKDTDWIEHPDGDDIAVRPLGQVPVPAAPIREQGLSGYAFFDVEQLVSVETFQLGVGPVVGDECLMVGRYVNHDGEQFDSGVVRFGNLSMYPEKVWQKDRSFDQESFLVDMRSAAGFSGSVVVVYFAQPGTVSAFVKGGPEMPLRDLISKYWILGIDWGHLPVPQRIWEDGKSKRVLIESSMAAVIPAWKLTELLNDVAAVVKPRQEAEAELAKENQELDDKLKEL